MAYILQVDKNFKLLYESLNERNNVVYTKIASAMGAFRKSLSYAWLSKFVILDPITSLSCVIMTLLKYTEHPDASIRVTSYLTLGSLLLCVAPYCTSKFIRAFGMSTVQISPSPRSSFAIINIFTYLSHFVSPVRMQEFIILIPVQNHFQTDISDFLKYLPRSIPLMTNLPFSFLQSILQTLILYCSKTINSNFTQSVYSLICLNKPQLLSELLILLKKVNHPILALSLGPSIFSDRKLYSFLDQSGRNYFLDIAFHQLQQQNSNYTDFESACLICAHSLKWSSGTSHYQELYSKIFSLLRDDYPPYFLRLKLLLPMALDDIFAIKPESASIQSTILSALSYSVSLFTQKLTNLRLDEKYPSQLRSVAFNPSTSNNSKIEPGQISQSLDDHFDNAQEKNFYEEEEEEKNDPSFSQKVIKLDKRADDIAEYFWNLRESTNDLYYSLIESFSKCHYFFFKNCKKNYHIELLEYILKRPNQNWVHDNAVANLISSLRTSELNQFFDLALDRLLFFSLSSNYKLSEDAIDSICKISSYSNLEIILLKLTHSDWIEESIAMHTFSLLSKLAHLFPSISKHSSPSKNLFRMFIRPAYECLLFTQNIQAISEICSFLSQIHVTHVPENVKNFCFDFIIRQYEFFSQTQMIFPNKEPIPVPQGSFLETIDTDIVSSPGFSHDIALAPVRHCFEFLCSLPLDCIASTNQNTMVQQSGNEISLSESNDKNKGDSRLSDLFYICIYLAPLFDKLALEEAIKINAYHSIDENTLWDLLIETFRNTSKDQVAAVCLKCFSATLKPLPLDVQLMIEKFLIEQRSEDTELLFNTFILVDQKEHEKAIQAVPTMTQHFPYKSATILLYKLAYVLGKSMVDSINETYSIALLQYALMNHGVYEEKIHTYLRNYPYSRWPIGDKLLDSDLASFLKKHEKIKLGSLSKLSVDHWKFLINNNQFFELNGVVEYIQNNIDSFKKIDISPLINYNQSTFSSSYHFEGISVETVKLCSASPIFAQGHFIYNQALLISFFNNTYKALDVSIIKLILTKSGENCNDIILTALFSHISKFSILFNDSDIIKSLSLFSRPLPPSLFIATMYLFKNRTFSKLPNEIFQLIIIQLGKKPEPEDIFDAPKNDILISVINIDPQYFLNYYVEISHTTIRRCHSLVLLIPYIDFDGIMLHEIIASSLPLFSSFSPKKRLCFLRLISSSIDCLFRRMQETTGSDKKSIQKVENYKTAINAIKSVIPPFLDLILESQSAGLFSELLLLPLPKDFKEQYANSLSLPFRALLTVNNDISSDFIANLITPFQPPSIITIGINLLINKIYSQQNFNTAFLSSSPQANEKIEEARETLKNLLYSLQGRFVTLSNNFLTVKAAINLVSSVFDFPLSDIFFDSFNISFLSSNNNACFIEATSTPDIIQRFPSVLDEVFKIKPTNEILHSISSYFINLLKHNDSEMKELIQQQFMIKLLTYFENFSLINLGKMIMNIADLLQQKDDVCEFFFFEMNNIPLFLNLFVILKKNIKIPMLKSTAYQSSIFNEDDINFAFMIAASDSNNKEQLTKEYNSCL